MKHYSKRMVIVHWLTLALLVAAWFLGEELAEATDASKATLAGYIVHASVGGIIMLLALSQLYFRRKDGTPPKLPDVPMYQMSAKFIHNLIYTVLIVLPVSGMVTVFSSDAGKALLAGNASLLPKEHGYEKVFAHEVHEQLVTVLIVLAVLHIAGALKHQFIMKDGLMSRMWLGKKD